MTEISVLNVYDEINTCFIVLYLILRGVEVTSFCVGNNKISYEGPFDYDIIFIQSRTHSSVNNSLLKRSVLELIK